MTGLQTLCLFATGYLVSRLLLAAELHHDLSAWLLRRSRGRVSHVVLGVMLLAFALSTIVPNALTVLALLPVLARLRGLATEPAHGASPPALWTTVLAMALIYGAALGGVGSLLGSPANLYLLVSLRLYRVPGRESLHFLSWLAFGLPMALSLVGLLWGVLWITAPSTMASRLPEPPSGSGEGLAPQDRDRRRIALRFLGLWGTLWAALLAAGLLFGSGHPTGRAATPVLVSVALFGGAYAMSVLDAVALALSLGFSAALFAWPVPGATGRARLLHVRDLTRELPWKGVAVAGVVLALLVLLAWAGAGSWLRAQVPHLLPATHSAWLVTLVLVTVTIFATEVLNNTTVSTVLFPVAAAAAPSLGTDPLVVMLGISLASTCAFMTPVATPVNALAMASIPGISLRRFLVGGLLANLAAALWITLWLALAVPPILGLFGGR